MKILLIDMDGTINEFYDPVNNKMLMTEFPKGFFLNKRPIKSVIKVIQKDFTDYTKIIFSNSPSVEADAEKVQWLHSNGFSDCSYIFIHYPNDKGQALNTFMNRNSLSPHDITAIDDDHKILRIYEKLGVHCVHPSHLIAEYESKPEYYN